jgi:hypothetical protein
MKPHADLNRLAGRHQAVDGGASGIESLPDDDLLQRDPAQLRPDVVLQLVERQPRQIGIA